MAENNPSTVASVGATVTPAAPTQPTQPKIVPHTPLVTKYPVPLAFPKEEDVFITAHFYKGMNLALPGKGKTTLACTTLPDEMYPLAVLDVDGKAGSMPALLPFRQKGLIDIYDVSCPLIDPSKFSDRASNAAFLHQKLPEGFIRAVDTFNFILGEGALAAQAKKDGVWRPYRTVVVDTLSRIAEHVQRCVEYAMKSPSVGGWGDWQRYSSHLEEFISVGVLGSKINVICNMHLQRIMKTVGKSQVEELRPACSGQFRDKVVGYFNEVYMLEAKLAVGGVYEYVMHTHASDKVPARSSIVGIPPLVKQDMKPICELWKAQMLAKQGVMVPSAKKVMPAVGGAAVPATPANAVKK